MKRFLVLITGLLICLCYYAGASSFSLRLGEDTLSVEAEQVPLQDILRKLTEQGLEIKIDPLLNPPVTAHFKNRDLQQAVATIIRPMNHVLIWKAVDGPVGRMVRLSEIRIFEPGRKEMMQSLEKAAALSIEKDPATGIFYVKDEVLLTLKKGMTLEAFKDILHRINGTVIDSYPELGIYRIRLAENSDVPAVIEQLRQSEGVARTEPNYAYPAPRPDRDNQPPQPVPDLADSPGNPGNVPVAILDTGWNAVYDQDVSIKASFDAFHPEQPISDPLGHGTQMALLAAGMIKPYGVAMNQNYYNPVIPIRIFDENGYSSNFQVMKSIDFALANGARIISLSWGSETRSGFLENQLKLVDSKGTIVVAAAGNEPTGKPVYPAAYDSVIGVGALGLDGKTWRKSNYGDSVTLYAPGYAAFPVGYKGDPGTYAGTSISTAFMASLFADYLSRHPDANGRDVFDVLDRK